MREGTPNGLSRRTLLSGAVVGTAAAAVGLGTSGSAAAATLKNGRWTNPARGRISSPYGWRTIDGNTMFHAGTDVANSTGTAIYAAAAGTVIRRGRNILSGRTGYAILIAHGNYRYTYYGHLSRFRVANGANVSAGQFIADMGATGNVTGPHLHFEVHSGGIGEITNPDPYLRYRGADLGGGWSTLDPGARGQRVTAMQYLLRQRGKSLVVDGHHGSQTTRVLKEWQSSAGLVADGQCGPITWSHLDYTMRQGWQGNHVRAAQRLLRKHSHWIAVDGDFGSVTHSAVRSFQYRNRLYVDGVAGPITWKSLAG